MSPLKTFALVLLALTASCSETTPPDFVDIYGEPHRYESFSDKWVIVNYWATWCAPCIKEIPELNTLAEDHADRLVVLGVNFDEPEGEERVQQAEKMKIAFPVYATDPSAQLGVEKPQVLPTTFIFAPGMALHATLVGPQTEDSLLASMEGEAPPAD